MLLMLQKPCKHDTEQAHVQLNPSCTHADLPCELHFCADLLAQHRPVRYLRQSRPCYCCQHHNLRNRLPYIRYQALAKEKGVVTRAHLQG